MCTRDQFCLVAVLWDPVTQVFFASTIPVGERRKTMITAGPQKAPVWWSKVDNPKKETYTHAEDAVYFNWESVAPANRVQGGVYHGGLRIGVYGSKVEAKIVNGKQVKNAKGQVQPALTTPAQWSLCTVSDKSPACAEVARSLRITPVPMGYYRRDTGTDLPLGIL
ncbi:uncharacterized protein K489DRAFT_376779 [Dissoconium aciculare CBS 342.82]|uniref:Uncharacterized protein n=1 Tax=Dissoconium aciculare CBS 342.82 TaxID=1314786 RepID=A0A6J3MFE0_9PEZI|nr:uncharacterized protein K489DRAFT_376779 [Dissoconium aciculare CBS 342.82]KAF1826369.1 hypothetical protein K489DRAFT_376779 [Dissoconium aciculare CBS 342.82]